jgi:hypothetical protein
MCWYGAPAPRSGALVFECRNLSQLDIVEMIARFGLDVPMESLRFATYQRFSIHKNLGGPAITSPVTLWNTPAARPLSGTTAVPRNGLSYWHC